MHPMFWWWKSHLRDHCGPRGHRSHGDGWQASGGGFGDVGGGAFGVRRPLRFLAYKLDLTDGQVSEIGKVLADLKTERAQAEVDDRRTVAAFAEALAADTFGDARASEGGDLRVKAAERLRDAVLKALERIHAVLEPEQRERLAHMIRTGRIRI